MKKKGVLALFLSLAMTVTLIPATVFADDIVQDDPDAMSIVLDEPAEAEEEKQEIDVESADAEVAILDESSEPAAEAAQVEKFAYEKEELNLINVAGENFGMWHPQEGSTIGISGDNVVIHIVPKNTTTYAGFKWGSISDAAYANGEVQPTVDVACNEDGTIDLTLDKSYCGYAHPIAVVKKNYSKDSWTSASQYYLAIPTEDAILGKVSVDTENRASMFKVVKATALPNEDGSVLLTCEMSADGYHYFFKGTKDEAIANGDKTENWIAGYQNAAGAWLFDVPFDEDELNTYVPIVSISNSKYTDYLNGKCTLDKAFFARQLKLNLKDKTLITNSWIDPAPAQAVDEMIAKIQSQVFTSTTYEDCEAAKAAWDKLTDDEKELVEEADYFEADTGDASKDDALNADEIGENEILVVSFGTSFNDSRVATIGSVEKAIAAAYPNWSVRRAFTAQIIINHIYARDGEKIDNVKQALDRAVANGVKNLVVQPTHLMHGAEYDELKADLAKYENKMNIYVSEPLLGEVGKDTTEINADKEAVAKAITAEAVKMAGFDSLEAADAAKTAFVFMGHGTAHVASITYSQMQTQMDKLGYKNVFIGTVEGEPEDTACDAVIEKVKAAGYNKVILRPLMVVAGDHANNDMADPDDEESWYSQFKADGSFESIDCQINGLGEIKDVQDLYVAHTKTVITNEIDAVRAKAVDEMIEKIQSQVFTSTTYEDCEAAKAAWDALNEDQKALVEEGGYFADDTGDATKDDPLNSDGIGENEILVVSFGTSFNDSRVATIGGVEKAIAAAYPNWSVRRAFTAQIIINHIYARDGEKIDNMQQALERAVANGVKNLIVQPTHLMHGAEYDELKAELAKYEDKMTITVTEPLLGEVGKDTTEINADKEAVAKAITAEAVKVAGFDSLEAADTAKTAFVFMGHGTAHVASITYDQMQTQMDKLGYKNVFIGTVEGEPADTACDAVIAKVKAAGYTKVILRPLMVVAGDHANNDMADPEDEESWYSQFKADGSFESIECQINGLGEIKAVQDLYVAHVNAVVPMAQTIKATAKAQSFDYAALAKAKKTVSPITVTGAETALAYAVESGDKCISVAKATGKVTVARGTAAGTYSAKIKVTAAASDKYEAAEKTVTVKVTVKQSAQPMVVKAAKKTQTLTYNKSKAQTIKRAVKVTKAQGKVSYKITANKNAKNFSINAKGVITVKKGTKKGSYKITVTATAKGNKNYKKGSKKVTFTVKVK